MFHLTINIVNNAEPNRLMLFAETAIVWCENRTEHTDTLWAVRTSQETHHVSATEAQPVNAVWGNSRCLL
jgi:hypothetical protein